MAREYRREPCALKRERADDTLLEILYPLPFVVLVSVVEVRSLVPRVPCGRHACTIDQSDSSLTAISRTSGIPGDISVTSFRRDARALGRVLGERRRGDEVWLLFNTLVNKANNLSTAIQYSTGY